MKTKTWGYTIRVLLCAGALASGLTACSKREKVSDNTLVKCNTTSGPGKSFAISLPATNPFTSADTNLTLQGTCVTGASVEISGAHSELVTCSTGVYSFILTQSTDGTFNYSLAHTLPDASSTSTVPFQWIRDTTLPPTPTVTNPPISPVYTNTNGMIVSGACVAGNQVLISGDLSTTTPCAANGTYSAMVTAMLDNTYQLSVKQKNTLGKTSAPATVLWVRDTVAPSDLVLTDPVIDPVQNSLSTLVFSGSCEADAVVGITGDLTAQTACTTGTFNVSVSASTDGTYQLKIKQSDLAGNASAEVSRTWIRSTSVPSAPQIVSPSTNPLLNNQNSVLLSGTCDIGNTVLYSGASTGSANCVSGGFSVGLAGSTDGTRTYSFVQQTASGMVSPASSFTWLRDTVSPSGVIITGPGGSPHTTSGDSVILTGSCETGASVWMSGDSVQNVPCTSGQFSMSLNATTDATRTYGLKQIDAAGNLSPSISWSWIRNSAVPEPPTLSTPLLNPFYSNQNSVQLSGSCMAGATVRVEGVSGTEASTPCASGAYSLQVSRTEDGPFNFDLYQTSSTGVDSASLSFVWVRDTIAPDQPTLNSPATSPLTTNGNSIVVAGNCEDEATVTLDGDSQQQVVCSGGSYSFNVSATTDGIKNLLISQTDLAGNTSSQANQLWVRDTAPPLAITLQTPSSNPYISGDTFLSLTGTCETDAMVALVTLPSNNTTTSPCTPTGTFAFPLSQPGNGTFNYILQQKDAAGNISTDLTFEWTIDTSIPSAPVVQIPSVSPVYTNTRSLTIKVSCSNFSPLPGDVSLTGDVLAAEVSSPAGTLTTPCASNLAQFQLSKPADGSYSILIDQTNTNTGISSAPASILWVVDTVAPAMPTLIAPSTNPYVAPGDLTLHGTCETGATLTVQGAIQQTETCQNGSFNWVITHLPDGEYDFQIFQTDLALNTSPTLNFHWSRDINSVAPPVIFIPSQNPYISNQPGLTLSGSCTAGNAVTLSGSASASTTCSGGGTFTFAVNPTSDGTYTYNMTQTLNSVQSAPASFQWTRDTVAPIVQVPSQPSAINYSTNATFTFNASETVQNFECKLDNGTYSTCSSPSVVAPANGLHSYSIRATDLAGNVSLAQVINWEQKAYNTIALYHFDTSAALTTDSGPYLNHLTNSGSVGFNSTGRFSGAASYPSASAQNLSVAQNNTLNLGTAALTIEGFFRLSSMTTNGHYYTLVSKSESDTNLSYEVRLRRGSSSKYYIDFLTILAGTSTVITTSTGSLGTAVIGTWTYFAVTYNQGKVSIYTGQTAGGPTTGWVLNKSIGTPASTLTTTNSSLRIGYGPSGTSARPLNGRLDEVRISQTVRTVSTVPSAAFNPTQ